MENIIIKNRKEESIEDFAKRLIEEWRNVHGDVYIRNKEKIKKIEAMTQANGATAGEEESAKEKIERIKNKSDNLIIQAEFNTIKIYIAYHSTEKSIVDIIMKTQKESISNYTRDSYKKIEKSKNRDTHNENNNKIKDFFSVLIIISLLIFSFLIKLDIIKFNINTYIINILFYIISIMYILCMLFFIIVTICYIIENFPIWIHEQNWSTIEDSFKGVITIIATFFHTLIYAMVPFLLLIIHIKKMF